MYNIILILTLIGIIFFMTNNEDFSKKLNKHSVKLIFVLLLIYMLVNKLYHGVVIIIIVFLIYYNKEVIKFVKGKGINIDLNNFSLEKLTNKFQLSKLNITNNLNKSLESFENDDKSKLSEEFPKDEEENKKSNEDDDIFTQIDKLETLANKNENIKKEPFKNMVTELRKTFNTIYKQVNIE
jgi:Ca2+/Na+ antiporter